MCRRGPVKGGGGLTEAIQSRCRLRDKWRFLVCLGEVGEGG